jgi:hypothetical protein
MSELAKEPLTWLEKQLDYRQASDEERIRAIYPGDPIGNYYNSPELQRRLLKYERDLLLGAAAVAPIIQEGVAADV